MTKPASLLLSVTAALIALFGCGDSSTPPPVEEPPPPLCADVGQACTSTTDCCEGLVCTNEACAAPPVTTSAPIPAKTIGLDLMGIHDPDSDAYDGDCIGCHGDRAAEVALDGVTPAAHATMANYFGVGNDRCVWCHGSGPNFYDHQRGSGSLSGGGLREQVDMEATFCANCHNATTRLPFYAIPGATENQP